MCSLSDRPCAAPGAGLAELRRRQTTNHGLRGLKMERRGFTLLELLVVMSIIVVLMSISLPCLLRAKDSALALVAMEVAVDDEGKVFLEINDRPNRKATDDIYMIEIERPGKCSVRLKKPLPSGMKLRRKEGHDYIFWRPKPQHIGRHPVTVVFKGEETSEKEIAVYVYTKELLEAQREDKKDPH
jgi:prepilin-type N-terminal cleavage/methylation domain-containing protein